MKNKPLFSFALFLACFMGVLAYGQTQVAPFVNSHVQFSNASGAAPCNGCLLDTFAAGTTTPLATYSESTGTTPNANPVVLLSDGSAVVYMTNASYKLRLRTAAGATIWTQDQVTWNNLATTLSSLTLTGNATINSSTAATNVANQSGPTFCMDGNFWNGSASAVDSWCWNDVLGTGTNPTSTLTLVHSGSSGTPVFSVPALSASSATISGAVLATGGETISSGGTNRLIVDSSNYISVFTGIRPIQPDPLGLFHLGNDMVSSASGPADHYMEHLLAGTTTAVTLNIGANTNFLVGGVTVRNGIRGTVETGTTSILSVNAPILIGRGTANAETVNNGSWSIVDGTHITATCTKTHSGTTDIEQLGTTVFVAYQLMIDSSDVSPSQNADQPMQVIDAKGNGTMFLLPTNIGGTWPNSGFQVTVSATGNNGANKDFVIRHNNAASVFKIVKADNSGNLLTFDNSGNLSTILAGSRLAIGQSSATMAGDFRGAAIGAGFDGINITDGTGRMQVGYSTTSLAGTKLVPAQIQWGNAGTAGDLEIGARGNQATHVCLYTSPDAGTTGLVKNLCVNPDGSLLMKNPLATGTGATLSGTGACATITTQTGGSWAGRATCTGTTGASTLTITPGTTATNGWVCNVQDETTRANLLQQTATVAASCTLTATSVTQNDVFVFSAIAF